MTNSMNDNLKEDYPEITEWLTANDKNIENGYYNWNNAICYVLNRCEKNGYYELHANHSVTGEPAFYFPQTVSEELLTSHPSYSN